MYKVIEIYTLATGIRGEFHNISNDYLLLIFLRDFYYIGL